MEDIRGQSPRGSGSRVKPGSARGIEAAGRPTVRKGWVCGDFEFGAYWIVLDTVIETALSVPVLV